MDRSFREKVKAFRRIVTFYVAVAPQTIAPGIVVLVMEFYLAWSYRAAFRAF